MSKTLGFTPQAIDHDDIDNNNSGNPSFDAVLQARLSRRSLLRGGVGSAATAVLGGLSLAACGGGDGDDEDDDNGGNPPPAETLLGFHAVAKSRADTVVVPEGYSASVLYRMGDPIAAGVAAYQNDGSDDNYEQRAGDHHDGMEYFGLNAAGTARDAGGSERGLLAMNHEATSDDGGRVIFMHPAGGSPNNARLAAEVDKEVAAHGISIVEVRKVDGSFAYVQDSDYNRRFTPLTPVRLSGPARGNDLLKTKYSPAGTDTRGTLNNCGTGYTPWGTLLSGEENWANYFRRGADKALRGQADVALERYGRKENSSTRHGWESAGSEDRFARWDITQSGASAAADYRNEMNTYGYIVEVDPYDPTSTMRKRTALGRFAHESAAFSKLVAGKPLAVYMGDDSRGEYMYKFVSTATWNAADAEPANRITTGDKYLDEGRLYVAKFAADGSGQWIELNIANTAIASYDKYDFADQADVLVNARLAADAVGATKMDRPEWCATHPTTGEIYYTLTNNSNRKVEPSGSSQVAVDAANPRSYADAYGGTAADPTKAGNHNGHIIRIRETGDEAAALTFSWDVYLFGAEAGADAALVNLSGLTADQDFSSPDGLWFSRATGICWIQTDDGAYTDVTNCMMLAALPGQVGDGARKTLTHARADGSTLTLETPVGKAATAGTLKRFLVGPVGSEITGCAETPDGKTLFVNIQHPGESTQLADIGTPANYTSHWPDGGNARPRSATVVITKDDGGRIGS
ncbi:PhoX family phosphatase [Aquabacterium sp. A7-Y]|uniref:PhoX family protein n=1 Tax=Aquabacterium sp. A7-Y TaxID=1349605 RepID=UPI00223DA74F|nr:PhoX family phosphatase [Aquabacterium sp. A7-Y]MCW7536363.1 PhoX family phosphatase [Aquabacterium sp. A7-Y]